MELMSTLTSEQHVSKELAARLSQQEEELKEIREQVCINILNHSQRHFIGAQNLIDLFHCHSIWGLILLTWFIVYPNKLKYKIVSL